MENIIFFNQTFGKYRSKKVGQMEKMGRWNRSKRESALLIRQRNDLHIQKYKKIMTCKYNISFSFIKVFFHAYWYMQAYSSLYDIQEAVEHISWEKRGEGVYLDHFTSINFWFFDIFRGYKNRTLAWNGWTSTLE